MKLKNSNRYQGLSHLMIIAFVPLLMVGAWFVQSLIVKGMFISLLIFLIVFIWKKLVNH